MVGRLLQLEEVADLLGVSKRYVQDLIYSQKLGCVRIGRKVRVPESTVVDLIESCSTSPGNEVA